MNASLDPSRLSDPAPVRGLPSGTVIERLDIVRPIADTGLCVEYLAIDHANESKVLLREYLPARLARREGELVRPQTKAAAAAFALGLQAFVAEGRLLAGINQAALVHVTDVIEANGTAYQVMPRRVGARLLQARQELTSAPAEQALRALLDGLLGALDALHHGGTLHGSVSPGNILLLADDRPLLLAPDLARTVIASDLVESLMAAVEPSFAAPEQQFPSQTHPLGPWTDLYSLAETMRFCMSGELPPPAAGARDRGPRETMTPLARRLFAKGIAMHYSKPLLDALDAALRPDPAARPQSVAAFRDALSAKAAATAPPNADKATAPASGSPTPAAARVEPDFRFVDRRVPPPTAAPAALKPPRNTPRHALRTGMALALLLAAGTYGWWTIEQPLRSFPPASVVSTAETDTPVAPPPAPPAIAEAPTMPPQAPAPVLATPPPKAALAVPVTPPAPAAAIPASPRDACAGRTQFSLYRCMQAQCEQPDWAHHPQCQRLRSTDSVD